MRKLLLSVFLVVASTMTTPSAFANIELLPKLKEGQPLPHDLFINLAKAVNPAVVNIYTAYLPKRPQGFGGRGMDPRGRDPIFDLFEQFMGPMPQAQPAQSLGTGFIIREDGLIVTNNHVIDGADEIKVKLEESSKESLDAEVIGRDAKTDIALIKIKPKKKLSVVKFGSSKDLQVGEWVAAFGNPYGHGHSMTKGIVSAIGREIEELNMFPFIQTDASINPGNSGGPLVNSQGLVIGVNTAIDARAQGIGFAIPIDQVKELIPILEKNGEIKRGYMGVGLQDLDEQAVRLLKLKDSDGALITQVMPNSPASRAGLKAYDVVQEFNDKKIESSKTLSVAVSQTPIGEKVNMKVIREGAVKNLKIQIGSSSDAQTGDFPKGQNAPFDLGFALLEPNPNQTDMKHPMVSSVSKRSAAHKAGLATGDLIMDVNKKPTQSVKDVFKALKKKDNILRVFKDGRVVLIGL